MGEPGVIKHDFPQMQVLQLTISRPPTPIIDLAEDKKRIRMFVKLLRSNSTQLAPISQGTAVETVDTSPLNAQPRIGISKKFLSAEK